VKVHKLNEMGEIVDKKGHRAWDMACALQLGIRVNVRFQRIAMANVHAIVKFVLFSAISSKALSACARARRYAWSVAEFCAGEEQVGMNSQASYSKVPDFETFQEHVKLKFPS
jgi:hypothetical protein